MLVRGQVHNQAFADEVREATDAIDNVHEESRALREKVEELGKLLSSAKANVVQLDQLTTAQARSTEDLCTELSQVRAELEVVERELTETQSRLAEVESQLSMCESSQSSSERIIQDLHGKVEFYQGKLEALGSEKLGNAQKLLRTEEELRALQKKLQKSQEIEKYLKDDLETQRKEMKEATEELQALYAKASREASENEAAGRGLLEAVAGHVSEKMGVGMVVRTVAQGAGNLSARTAKTTDFSVKQLVPGGSASQSGQIEVNDIVVAVNNVKLGGLSIEEVDQRCRASCWDPKARL